jgi:hypothetical protein
MRGLSPPDAPVVVHTALGGVLHLASVVPRLSLLRLPSLASPWGAWGWVELVARALLLGGASPHAADPIWPLLAALDQRDAGDPLGAPVEATTARAAQGWLPPAASRRPLPPAATAIVPDGGLRLAEQAVAVTVEHLTAQLARPLEHLIDRLLCRPATIMADHALLDVHYAMDETDPDLQLLHRASFDAAAEWLRPFGRAVRLRGSGIRDV